MHKIKDVKPLDDCVVSAVFFDGTVKEYDIKRLYETFPQFKVFNIDKKLFRNVHVDVGGYGISWNDELDLDADDLWEYGREVGKEQVEDINFIFAQQLSEARDMMSMTQKQLSGKTGIHQADISKMERGIGNPSLSTLKRLADGMGMTLKIEFAPKEIVKD